MAKRVTITEEIKAEIRKQVGTDIDLSKIAVYRASAASTRPVSQRYSAYHGARMERSVLEAATKHLESESVPILLMHNGHMLPTGKVISAEVVEADAGHYELETLFYVQADSEYAEKIDLGIIDEVSVGMLTKHAFCSECGEDYLADGNHYNFWARECSEGHQIGVDGCHLRLVGLDTWSELSLVGKGASSKPKILAASKETMGETLYQRLAASGAAPEAIYLRCSATKQEPNMDTEKLIDQLTDAKASVATLTASNTQLDEGLKASQAEVAELKAKVAELEAKADNGAQAEIDELKAGKEAVQKDLDAATAFLSSQYPKAMVAAGLEAQENPSLEQMVEGIEQAQVKLAAIPRGGVSNPAERTEEREFSLAASAFQTK